MTPYTQTSGQARRASAIACFTTLFAVRLGLAILGLSRVHRLLNRLSQLTRTRGNSRPAHSTDEATQIASRLAAIVVYFPMRGMCLEQSLAMYFLLRRRGMPAKLQIGVQPLPFSAHAWIELDGTPINEDPEVIRQYTRLEEIRV